MTGMFLGKTKSLINTRRIGLILRKVVEMSDILISHVNADHERVGIIVELLEKHQWSVWWNQKIQPGDAIDLTTEAELDQAKIVITAWSEKSVLSRLIRNTAFEAIESSRWLPLRFDSVKLPLRYRHYQTIDIDRWPEHHNSDIEDSVVEWCQALIHLRNNEAASAEHRTNQLDANKLRKTLSRPMNNGNDSAVVLYSTLQLGEWIVEEGQNRIVCGERVKRITPRSMQVLMLLIDNIGNPVSIEQILSRVWTGRVVVDSVVHRCIKELRDAFEDKFKAPRYIETIAKRGYRIIAPLANQAQPKND